MGFIYDIVEVIRWFKERNRAKMDAWIEQIKAEQDSYHKKKKKKDKK